LPGFAVAYGARAFTTSAPGLGYEAKLLWLDAVVLPLILFVTAAKLVASSAQALRIAAGLMLGGVVLAVIGIAEKLLGFELATRSGGAVRSTRGWGSCGSRAVPGSRAVRADAADRDGATLYWLQARRPPAYLVGGIALVLQAAAIGLTFFRTAWIAAALVLVMALMRPGRHARSVLIVAYVLALTGLAFTQLEQDRQFSARVHNTQNIDARLATYEQAIAIAKRKPITGVGVGQYTMVASTLPVTTVNGVASVPAPHDSYLGVLAETGIVGLAPLVAATAAVWFALRKFRRRMRHGADAVLATCVTAAAGRVSPHVAAARDVLVRLAERCVRALARCGLRPVRGQWFAKEAATASASIAGLGVRRWAVIAARSVSPAERFVAREGSWTRSCSRSSRCSAALAASRGGAACGSRRRDRAQRRLAAPVEPAVLRARARRAARARAAHRRRAWQARLPRSRTPRRRRAPDGFPSTRCARLRRSEARRCASRIERTRTRTPPPAPVVRAREGEWILALWPGSGGGFGGAATHISGILAGFRSLGFRVALVTRYPLGEQLQDVVDEAAVLAPPPAAHRVTSDVDSSRATARSFAAGWSSRAGCDRRSSTSATLRSSSPVRGSPSRAACRSCSSGTGRRRGSARTGSRTSQRRRSSTRFSWRWNADVVRRSTLIAAVSDEAGRMALDAGAAPGRVLVLPNAVDVRRLDAAVEGAGANGDGAGVRLGWAGSFGPWHGSEVTVQALAQLPEDVRLVMVGDGDRRAACESLSRRLGVADRIEWTGALPHDLALRTLAGCDVLVSPHTPLADRPFFGSPTKIFEYMALERRSRERSGPDRGDLRDGVTARLVTPGDVDGLARAIVEVLRSPDRGRALASRARREAAANHTWDERAEALWRTIGLGRERGTEP
jgi:O-antigen ligase